MVIEMPELPDDAVFAIGTVVSGRGQWLRIERQAVPRIASQLAQPMLGEEEAKAHD